MVFGTFIFETGTGEFQQVDGPKSLRAFYQKRIDLLKQGFRPAITHTDKTGQDTLWVRPTDDFFEVASTKIVGIPSEPVQGFERMEDVQDAPIGLNGFI